MSINRELWKVPFRADSPAQWKCPTCKTGHLLLIPEKLNFHETNESKGEHNNDDWDPDWIRYDFAASFACNNNQCKEIITCAGEGRVDGNMAEDNNGYIDMQYQDVFFPKYFSRPLDVFDIPPSCPQEIRDEVRKAFHIFMADPSAGSNHVRSAIEHLMNYLQIKRFDRKNGKLVEISLHRRIKIYEVKKKALADKLLAIKWLGNAGSHPGGVSLDDMLDAFDILALVLNQMLNPLHKDLDVIVNDINRHKGPLQKIKSRRRKKTTP